MPGLEGMNVRIGADLTDLIQGITNGNKSLQNFSDQLARFRSRLATATDPSSIIRLNRAIEATQQRITAINRAGTSAVGGLVGVGTHATIATTALNATRGSSDRAGQALMNLGRIAQDGSYGFIGIANNLSPLLESFQRLSATSGGLKGTMSALGASLMGAGGVGLALSAFQFVALGGVDVLKKFASQFFTTEVVINRARDAHKSYIDVLNSGAESSAKEITNLRVLEIAATDVAKPMSLRLQAVNDLQKQFPSYLGNIKDEAILHGDAAKQINLVADALTKKAFAEAASGKASEIAGKQLDLELRRNFLINEQSKVTNELNNQRAKNVGGLSARFEAHQMEVAEKHLAEINKLLKINGEQSGFNAKQIEFFTSKAADGYSAVKSLEIDKKGKAPKDVLTLSEALDALKDKISAINKEFEVGILSGSDKIKDSAAAIQSTIAQILSKPFNLSVNSPQVKGLILDVDRMQSLGNARAAVKDIVKAVKEDKDKPDGSIEVPLTVKPNLQMKDNNFDSYILMLQKWSDDIKSLAETTLTKGLSGIGDNIGDALMGKGGLNDVFGNIFNTIGGFLQELGVKMIDTSALITALKASLGALIGPGTLLAGIGLVALGQAMKTIPKFATGGLVGGSGNQDSVHAMLMPGEFVMRKEIVKQLGIPFLSNLNQGQFISPIMRLPALPSVVQSNRLNEISGGGVQVHIPSISLRGSDLLIAFDRAEQQRGRRG